MWWIVDAAYNNKKKNGISNASTNFHGMMSSYVI